MNSQNPLPQANATTRICIVTPEHYPSETFIRAHEELLPGEKLILTGCFPDFHYQGRLLSTQFNSHNRIRRFQKLLPHLLFERFGDRLLSPSDIAIRSLYEFFRKAPVDVILAEYGTTGANLVPVARALDIPLVVHFHGHDAYHRGYLSDFSERFEAMFRYASTIVSVSQAMTEQLVQVGASREKIILNPYGPREEFYQIAPSYSPHLVAVGRFVEMKAPQITLAAFHRALDSVPEGRLVMVGDGPLREACMALASAWGLDLSVSFPGLLPHGEIRRLFQSSCAFVQHSLQSWDGVCEGTPVAILEAGAAALPVISTRHAGIPQAVLDGETGWLVDEGDLDGMAKSMVAAMRDPRKCEDRGKSARVHIRENYSIDRHIRQLHQACLQSRLG